TSRRNFRRYSPATGRQAARLESAVPQQPTDFVEGIITPGGNGDVATQAAGNDGNFALRDRDDPGLGDKMRPALLRHDQHFAVGIVEKPIGAVRQSRLRGCRLQCRPASRHRIHRGSLPRETRGYVLRVAGLTAETWKRAPVDNEALTFVPR